MALLRVAVGALALLLAGCGDAGGRGSERQTIMSDHGLLRIEVRPTPDPPVRGDNVVQLVITNAAGAPVDGLQLDAQPWMPAHGHGTSVIPTVTAQGGGQYQLDHVYLYMAGTWELRLAFTGTESDTATPAFSVP